MLRKIISGGQTGADRAGLDFAIEAGLEPHARVQGYRLRFVTGPERIGSRSKDRCSLTIDPW
jgi:hypothetical protein